MTKCLKVKNKFKCTVRKILNVNEFLQRKQSFKTKLLSLSDDSSVCSLQLE